VRSTAAVTVTRNEDTLPPWTEFRVFARSREPFRVTPGRLQMLAREPAPALPPEM